MLKSYTNNIVIGNNSVISLIQTPVANPSPIIPTPTCAARVAPWGCAPPHAARGARCIYNKTITPAPRRTRRGSGPAPPRAARVAGGGRTPFLQAPAVSRGKPQHAPHAPQLGLRSTTRRTRRPVKPQPDISPRSTPHASRTGVGPAMRRARRRRGPNFLFYQPLLEAGVSPDTRRTRRSRGCAGHQSSTTPTGGHATSHPRPPSLADGGSTASLQAGKPWRQREGGNLPSKFPPFLPNQKRVYLTLEETHKEPPFA